MEIVSNKKLNARIWFPRKGEHDLLKRNLNGADFSFKLKDSFLLLIGKH